MELQDEWCKTICHMNVEEESLSITKCIPPELSPILYLCSHVLCFGCPEMVQEALWELRLITPKSYRSMIKFHISDVHASLPLLLCLTYRKETFLVLIFHIPVNAEKLTEEMHMEKFSMATSGSRLQFVWCKDQF